MVARMPDLMMELARRKALLASLLDGVMITEVVSRASSRRGGMSAQETQKALRSIARIEFLQTGNPGTVRAPRARRECADLRTRIHCSELTAAPIGTQRF